MAAANEGEGVGRIGERAAENDGGGVAAGVNEVHSVRMLGIGSGALAYYAKLAVYGNMNPFGQIVCAKNRQADAEVYNHTVGEFLSDTPCYKGLNQAFFHFIYPP